MVTCASKLNSFRAIRCVVTVEPMLFFYFYATVLSTFVGTNLLLHKGCDPNATAAPDLQQSPECLMEKSAQQGVASINTWKNVIQELLSVIFIVFAGPWSDNHGRRRRPLMYVPVFGQIVCDAMNLLFSVFWRTSPAVAGIVQSVAVSTTGSYPCFMIGVFAYISDVTNASNRTMRIGFAAAVLPLAATLGGLSFGHLNVRLGFTGFFALNIGINVLALFLGFLFIYDTSEPYKPAGSLYKSTFDPKIIRNSFRTAFVKRDHHKRFVLLLMILGSPLTSAPFVGEINLMYLYLRNRFNFKEVDFSYFNAYTTLVMLVGSLLSLGLFSRVLRMNDAMIGLIATFFDLIAAIAFLVVVQIKYLCFIPLLEIFRGAALSLVGAIASKCVEPHELGSMNSIRTVSENLSKMAILPLYNIVYYKTLETMPSAYFIITICLTVPLIGCFVTTYYLTRNQVKSNEIRENDSEVKPNDCVTDSVNNTQLNNIVGLK